MKEKLLLLFPVGIGDALVMNGLVQFFPIHMM
jgi:hypothetical protein